MNTINLLALLVAVYLISLIITDFALKDMIKKLTAKGRQPTYRNYDNVMGAAKFIRVLGYIPGLNTIYAVGYIFAFLKGFIFGHR